jgi:SAM-dependent methyltransferase
MNAAFDNHSRRYEQLVTDSIAFTGLEHRFFQDAKIDQMKALFAEKWGAQAKPSMLDIGCGVGRIHPLLRPIVGHLAGSDISRDSLSRAAEANPGVDYRLAKDMVLPWDDASFDTTLAIGVLHHIEKALWPAFMAEMRRVTRPGGLLLLVEHNPWNPLTRLAVFRCPFDDDATLLSSGRAAALLREAGCGDVSSRYFLVFPTASRPLRAIEKRLARLPIGAQYLAVGTA